MIHGIRLSIKLMQGEQDAFNRSEYKTIRRFANYFREHGLKVNTIQTDNGTVLFGLEGIITEGLNSYIDRFRVKRLSDEHTESLASICTESAATP